MANTIEMKLLVTYEDQKQSRQFMLSYPSIELHININRTL